MRNAVNLLRARLELGLDLGFHFQPLARVSLRPGVNLVENGRQVGEHERVRVLRAEKIPAFLRQVCVVALFLHREEEFLLLRVKLLLRLVGVQFEFRLVHQAEVVRVFEQLQESFGPRLAHLDAVEQQADFPLQRLGIAGL